MSRLLQKQPPAVGEALSDEFDGKILNPDGVEIRSSRAIRSTVPASELVCPV
jgi:hypothetical protein